MSEEFGSSEAGKKGGKARAKKLSKEERSEIARVAAEARWGSDIPQSTHEGDFPIGEAIISAAVLPDGKRLLTQATFLRALGRSRSPKAGTGVLSTVDGLPFFLQAEALKPFISEELASSTTPVFFRDKSGKKAVGYEATLLPSVAEVYLRFRDSFLTAGKPFPKRYEDIIRACDIVMRGLARVGIVALVDEATGYQRDRARDELAKILEAFVAKEIQKWMKTFDLEFYELICELRGMSLEKAKKRPKYFGLWTNNLVYCRLAPGVLEELKKLSPADANGYRKNKLFQGLTPEYGHPKLKEHLAGVTTAMKFAKLGGMTWDQFIATLDKTHPKFKPMPLLNGIEDQHGNVLDG